MHSQTERLVQTKRASVQLVHEAGLGGHDHALTKLFKEWDD